VKRGTFGRRRGKACEQRRCLEERRRGRRARVLSDEARVARWPIGLARGNCRAIRLYIFCRAEKTASPRVRTAAPEAGDAPAGDRARLGTCFAAGGPCVLGSSSTKCCCFARVVESRKDSLVPPQGFACFCVCVGDNYFAFSHMHSICHRERAANSPDVTSLHSRADPCDLTQAHSG